MAGTLYFGCGTADQEAALWRLMLHRPDTRIVYWPFALPAKLAATADAWLRNGLDRIGRPYQLQTWQRLSDHDPAELDPDQVDLLFVGGGNTFRLLDIVQRAGFVQAVRDFHAAGGDYYGGSAGAVLACNDIVIADGHDPNDSGLTDLGSLGLLPGWAILPHYTDDQLQELQRWSADHQQSALGLPESVGLRCEDQQAMVVGHGRLTVITNESTQLFAPGTMIGLAH